MYVIRVPYWINLSEKKRFYLNLNQYRNAHFHVLHRAKVMFAEIVTPMLADVPALNAAKFSYRLYTKTRADVDVPNVCSIVDKFFQDTFVAAGKLDDDNYRLVPGVEYVYGGYDPTNPGVEVVILPL